MDRELLDWRVLAATRADRRLNGNLFLILFDLGTFGASEPPGAQRAANKSNRHPEALNQHTQANTGQYHDRNNHDDAEDDKGAGQTEHAAQPAADENTEVAASGAQLVGGGVDGRMEASDKVRHTTDAHEPKGEPDAEAGAIDIDLAPEHEDRQAQKDDRYGVAAEAEGTRETSLDDVSGRAQEPQLGQKHEEAHRHERQDPEVTAVTLPDTGLRCGLGGGSSGRPGRRLLCGLFCG